MNSRSVIILFVLAYLMFSCAEVSYWQNRYFEYPYYPQPVEIQLSDSTLSIYKYDNYGDLANNSGSATIRKAKVVGDTILAYNYRETEDSLNNTFHEEYIEFAYITKGGKLFEITHYMPSSVWRNDDSHKFYHDSSLIDTSKLVTFTPVWNEWRWGEAYIDYGDNKAYKAGKNKRLRKQLETLIESNDYLSWFYDYGVYVSNDSAFRLTKHDTLGPLQIHRQ